jgi:hypothetical protein
MHFLGLCVGTSTGNKNEILELALPDKMLQSEEDGVCIHNYVVQIT